MAINQVGGGTKLELDPGGGREQKWAFFTVVVQKVERKNEIASCNEKMHSFHFLAIGYGFSSRISKARETFFSGKIPFVERRK